MDFGERKDMVQNYREEIYVFVRWVVEAYTGVERSRFRHLGKTRRRQRIWARGHSGSIKEDE